MAITVQVTGVKETLANVRQLPKRLRRKAYRVALNAAGGVFKREVVKRSPKETGLLRRSMGVKTAVPRSEKASWVKVGPRRGFKQAIGTNKKGKLKLVAKKTEKLLPAGAFAKYRNPTRYAHLVEGGTKRGVKGTGFMKLSAALKQTEAVSKMESKLRAAVWSYRNN